jgi:hypothetical protein
MTEHGVMPAAARRLRPAQAAALYRDVHAKHGAMPLLQHKPLSRCCASQSYALHSGAKKVLESAYGSVSPGQRPAASDEDNDEDDDEDERAAVILTE